MYLIVSLSNIVSYEFFGGKIEIVVYVLTKYSFHNLAESIHSINFSDTFKMISALLVKFLEISLQ